MYISEKDAAKEIRVKLKAAFPGVKFWVTSKSSIDVSWVDGSTKAEVEAIARQYQSEGC